MSADTFTNTIWKYYNAQGRHDLPWRQAEPDGTFDAYKILVSEIMLQQTQVNRVLPKYLAFLKAFPTVQSLATAPLSEVLTHWSGLGYNRRAKFLWQAAGQICHRHDGQLPRTKEALTGLPGIGPNTAGAIMAYAYNLPVIFIETNIRTVYIHHFFSDQQKVADSALVPLLKQTLPADRPRAWYWALMDYGTHLKQTVGNASRASTSHTKQSPFVGSRRQIRGQIIRLLTEQPQTVIELQQLMSDDRLAAVLHDLTQEGFIEEDAGFYRLRMV